MTRNHRPPPHPNRQQALVPDGYTVIRREMSVDRIMQSSGVPAQADQWWYGFTFYGFSRP
jgi:hypothetical protein